jgi:catechol 2,3-dioxygenase-like lactoylglutathione lyase family enzyme
MAKIRHIAFHTSDPEKMAKFYCDCFGMTIQQDYPEVPGTARAIFITDGDIEVALIQTRSGKQGINHFGFTLDAEEKPQVYGKIKQHGVAVHSANPDRPYVEDFLIDVDGNKVDLSTKGLSIERQHIKEKLGHA